MNWLGSWARTFSEGAEASEVGEVGEAARRVESKPRFVVPTELPDGAGPYDSESELLRDVLLRADYRLRALVIERWPTNGLSLERELSTRSRHASQGPELPRNLATQRNECLDVVRRLGDSIRERIARTENASCRLGWTRLVHAFDLTPAEADAIAVCLLTECDAQAARWIAVLQGEERRSQPSTRTLIDLVNLGARNGGAEIFGADRPWIELGVVRLEGGATLAARPVCLSEHVAGFLLGSAAPAGELAAAATEVRPRQWDDVLAPAEQLARLRHLAGHWTGPGGAKTLLKVVLHGPEENGQMGAASAFCAAVGMPLLAIDLRGLLHQPEDVRDAVVAALREMRLTGTALYWLGLESLSADAKLEPAWNRLLHLLERASTRTGVLFFEFNAAQPSLSLRALTTGHCVHVEFPAPSYELRLRDWRMALSPADATLAEDLANAFQLTQGGVRGALAAADSMSWIRSATDARQRAEDLFEACRQQSVRQLVSFARRISPDPCATLQALVVQPNTRQQLQELHQRVKYRGVVYGELGFERRLALGKGLIALFVGPSGTGKTFAASILASLQKVDLYKVDLSAIVSKYVGETEQHLARVFAEAEAANAFLFFDEADCIFGKRGEVREARDRWANMEVNYLLQRVEEFSGTVILATNLRQNIDEAFLRRIHLFVEFPFPGEEERHDILSRLIPETVSAPDEATLREFGRRFPLAGGSLKNVVLDATFRAVALRGKRAAASQNGAAHCKPHITAAHLAAAVAREYQKLGRPISMGEFGPWYDDVNRELAPDAETWRACGLA